MAQLTAEHVRPGHTVTVDGTRYLVRAAWGQAALQDLGRRSTTYVLLCGPADNPAAAAAVTLGPYQFDDQLEVDDAEFQL